MYALTKEEPPESLRALASLDQWERVVETRARQAIQFGDYWRARNLLDERPDRTSGSALYAVEGLSLMMTGDLKGAEERIEAGIASAELVNRVDRLVELWRLRGQLYERQKRFADSDEALVKAQNLAMRADLVVLALQIYAGRARLSTLGPVDAPPPEELAEIVNAASDTDFASVRLQIRGLYRTCGPHSLPLLRKGLRVFRLDGNPALNPVFRDSRFGKDFAAMQKDGRTNEFLLKLLDERPDDAELRRNIANALEEALNPTRSQRLK